MIALISFLDFAVTIYTWVLIARILLSWFPLPNNPTLMNIYDFIYSITEPFLAIFRRFIPPVMLGGAGIDLSPIVAFLVLRLGWDMFLKSLLLSIA